MTRNARINDIDQMVIFLKKCFDEMEYAKVGYSYDIGTVRKTIKHCIETGVAIVYEIKDRIMGIGLVFLVPSFMDANNIIAVEIAWHSDPDLDKRTRFKIMDKLLKGMEKEIKKTGVNFLSIGSSEKYPSISKYLVKKGYKLNELIFRKEVV